MKITKKNLEKIIKEELTSLLSEQGRGGTLSRAARAGIIDQAFTSGNRGLDAQINQIKQKLGALDEKLEAILSALKPNMSIAPEDEEI